MSWVLNEAQFLRMSLTCFIAASTIIRLYSIVYRRTDRLEMKGLSYNINNINRQAHYSQAHLVKGYTRGYVAVCIPSLTTFDMEAVPLHHRLAILSILWIICASAVVWKWFNRETWLVSYPLHPQQALNVNVLTSLSLVFQGYTQTIKKLGVAWRQG
jgi:hypothetical protein